MNLKTLATAALLATTAATSFANTIQEGVVTLDDGGFGFSVDKTFSGKFSTTYEFTLDTADEVAESVTNSFTTKSGKITDFTVELKGMGIDEILTGVPVTGGQAVSYDFAELAAGTYDLTISGTAYKSTYGGSVSVSAVPEPANMALMLAGLGCMGVMVKRRKQG